MTPGIYNFTLYQGTSDGLTLVLKDDGVVIDLTGYTAEAKFRRGYNRPPVLTFSTTDGNAIVTGADGKIELKLEPDDTIPLRGFNRDGELALVYDIEVTAPVSGAVTRVLMGDCILSQEVTR